MIRIPGALLLAVIAAAGLAAQQPAAPQSESPPVIFRAEVNYVEVDAVVTDSAGHSVPGLTAADFDVLEDGKPQKVATLSRVDLPIQRAERPLFAATVIQPDVQTNDALEGRVYLLVLDDLHTDLTRTPRVKAAARRFIEQNFGVNDIAAVVFTGGRTSDSQDFTNNPRLLLAAIDKFYGRKLRSATLTQLDGVRAGPGGGLAPGDDVDAMERAFRARNVMATIRKLSEFLAGVRGRRKALLLISEGVDYDINQAVGLEGATASSVMEDTHDAIAAATRGNVVIYTIDPRGLRDASTDLIETGFTLEEQGIGLNSMDSEVRLSQQSLRTLAEDTGGFAAVNQNDFDRAFDRIVQENSAYYLLGYYPTNEKRDGRYRKVQVRVKRPGLMVRSRRGYVAPRGKASAPPKPAADATPAAVAEALGSPLPIAGVPIRVFAAPFKGAAPNAAIALVVELDASRLDFVNRNGAWIEHVEVVSSATDTNSRIFPGERARLNLALKPETYERVTQRGLRVLEQADLPPGRYQLRVAAGNASGKAGSVVYDLEVPDFAKQPLSMSGVALTSLSASAVDTVAPKNPLKDYLPSPATASREFRQGDTLTLFAEVYENGRGNQTRQVAITTELRSDDGRVVRKTSEQRSSAELQGTSGGYGFTAGLALAGVPPGIYVIHVQVEAQSAGLPMVARDIQIRVVP